MALNQRSIDQFARCYGYILYQLIRFKPEITENKQNILFARSSVDLNEFERLNW